ncbi:MAG: SH3 domain-containing protein, partial [Peptostreptococcaceae bacterium]
ATSVALPLCSSISEANGAEYRTITGNSVNLRKGPGTNHASIGKLNKGYKVEYLGNDGSWIKVKYDGKTGYVHGDYVGSSNNSNEDIKFNKVVTATSLNFRSGAGTKYSKIGSIKKGTEVGVISESNGWSKIKYSGKVGYVSSEYLASEGGSSNNSNETVKSYKIVDATSLNIRSGPGTNYSKIGSVKNKAEVGVISESNGWSKIKYSGKVGYVSSKYLINKGGSSSGGSNDSSESVKSYKIVDATSLNVRSGPGTNYSKIGSVKNNEEVGIISESNGWSKIKYSGKVGYVSSEYLVAKGSSSNDNSTSSDKADKVISLAKTLLGKKYSWGAEGPNAFDCSGYTYYVFKKSAGITIPRVSKDQSKHGKSVSRSNVVKGDLVFFDTEGSNNGQITHVGIYMGDGNFIHASSSKGKVVISDFNSSYYKKAFVNARRVL